MLCSAVADVFPVTMIFDDDLVIWTPSSRGLIPPGSFYVTERVLLGLLVLDVVYVIRYGHANGHHAFPFDVDLAISTMSAVAAAAAARR